MIKKLLPIITFLYCIDASGQDTTIITADTLNTAWNMKYGQVSKDDMPYAFTKISSDRLRATSGSFLVDALYGLVPGAMVQAFSNQPGMDPSIFAEIVLCKQHGSLLSR